MITCTAQFMARIMVHRMVVIMKMIGVMNMITCTDRHTAHRILPTILNVIRLLTAMVSIAVLVIHHHLVGSPFMSVTAVLNHQHHHHYPNVILVLIALVTIVVLVIHHHLVIQSVEDAVLNHHHHLNVILVLIALVTIAVLVIHHHLVSRSVVTAVLDHHKKIASKSASLLAAADRRVEREDITAVERGEREDTTEDSIVTTVVMILVPTVMIMASLLATTVEKVGKEEKEEKEERVVSDTKFVNSSVNLFTTMTIICTVRFSVPTTMR